MLSILEPMKGRTKLHRHRLTKEIGEAGMDEDAEDEAGAEVQDSLQDSLQDRTLDRMLVDKVKVKDRARHKDSRGRGIIFPMTATSVVDMATRHQCAPVEELAEAEDAEDEVAIAGDVLEAEAKDVKQATRVWLEQAILRVLEPSQHPPSRRETSEAPDWPVQWTDGACTPEPSKPIWRGSKEEQDLIIADAEEEIAETKASTASVFYCCGEGRDQSSQEVI